jgi:hypothetical protein
MLLYDFISKELKDTAVAWERRPFWSLFAVFLPPTGGRQVARLKVMMAIDITDQHYGHY